MCVCTCVVYAWMCTRRVHLPVCTWLGEKGRLWMSSLIILHLPFETRSLTQPRVCKSARVACQHLPLPLPTLVPGLTTCAVTASLYFKGIRMQDFMLAQRFSTHVPRPADSNWTLPPEVPSQVHKMKYTQENAIFCHQKILINLIQSTKKRSLAYLFQEVNTRPMRWLSV